MENNLIKEEWIDGIVMKRRYLKGQKHERIITLEPDIKNGHILFNSINIQYNNQVRDYNKNCKHDDAPDSLYGAVQLI